LTMVLINITILVCMYVFVKASPTVPFASR
jgi:hypothetical protein